jgi:hypothetical protein
MEKSEQRAHARGLAAEAAAEWIRQHDGWEDAIVTGYVLIFEAVPPTGHAAFQWMTGNGATPTPESWEPLPAWRARGLAAELLSELDGRQAELSRREMEDE